MRPSKSLLASGPQNMFSVQFGKCYESTKKQSNGGAEIRNSFLDKETPWKRSLGLSGSQLTKERKAVQKDQHSNQRHNSAWCNGKLQVVHN